MSLCDHGYAEAHAFADRSNTERVDCPGPIVNIAFRPVDRDRPGHVEIDVFIGRRHSGRGRAGRLMLRQDEWQEIEQRILEGDPIELGITS